MRHSQLTDNLQEQATLYAAGAMTDDERAEYSRHLEDDQCPVCRAEVKELQAAVSMLAFTVPEASPSPRVRERLMEQARSVAPPRPAVALRPRPHWLGLLTSTVAVGAIVVAMAATRANNELRHLSDVLNSRIAQLEVQLTQNENYIATLTSPDVRVINLAGQTTNVQASGRIFWDAQRKKWFMYVKDLPPVPADKTYELWFVPKSGNPMRSVVFNTQPGGSVELQVDVPEGLDLKAAAVTTEPAGGTDQPTGTFALLGAM